MPGRPPQLLVAAGAALALHAAAALWLDAPGGSASAPRPAGRAAQALSLRLVEAAPAALMDAPPTAPPGAAPLPASRPPPGPAQAGSERCPSAAGLDRVALPYSQPDWQALDGSLPSGRPLRLRLHIDARGQVRHVDTVEADGEDADLLRRLRALLSATRYVPARQSGQDVASCLDLLLDATLPD
jgi:hypothetical protein